MLRVCSEGAEAVRELRVKELQMRRCGRRRHAGGGSFDEVGGS